MEPRQDATVAQLDDFDEVIDVRSPTEFGLDHVPGAVNCPVLSDAERAQVGTMYKQVSPFQARRLGAALVARNIAHQLETRLHDRGQSWRPLIYCWRGGGRSDAMCEVLRRVGWRAARLQGGYQAYRRAVVDALERLPGEFRFRVLCGRTGAGKSRVLRALAGEGAQVLDLEHLACHRGSVLGDLPGTPQPTQKLFESLLWQRLRGLDSARPVFVEAESRKVGNVQVPGALIDAIRTAECIVLEAPTALRIGLLMQEYGHLLLDNQTLALRLQALTRHYGAQTIARWTAMADAGEHAALVEALLVTHYDPAYDRSVGRNFLHSTAATAVAIDDASDAAMQDAARRILTHCASGDSRKQ